MKPTDNIAFYQRFRDDILSGKKTITIRNKDEAHFKAGQILSVATYEADEWFCNIRVINVEPLQKNDFNEQHAANENMTLEQLHSVIEDIYPKESQFYLIEFEVINKIVNSL